MGGFPESIALITFTQFYIHTWRPSIATLWCVGHWAVALEQSGLKGFAPGHLSGANEGVASAACYFPHPELSFINIWQPMSSLLE